jgi:hypothetical protein
MLASREDIFHAATLINFSVVPGGRKWRSQDAFKKEDGPTHEE